MAGHIMNFNGAHHAKELITRAVKSVKFYCHAVVQVGKNNNQPYHGRNCSQSEDICTNCYS